MEGDYDWTEFHPVCADKLLECKNNRISLSNWAHSINNEISKCRFTDDPENKPITDIDPFTFMNLFNRQMNWKNRRRVAGKVATFLGVDIPAPCCFEGCPHRARAKIYFADLSNPKSTICDDKPASTVGDSSMLLDSSNPKSTIDALWDIFEKAIEFTKYRDHDTSDQNVFIESINKVIGYRYSSMQSIAMVFYWVRPYNFLPLDVKTKKFLKQYVKIPNEIKGKEYLELIEQTKKMIQNKEIKKDENTRSEEIANSFPELVAMSYTKLTN